jgi:hypothetical protein
MEKKNKEELKKKFLSKRRCLWWGVKEVENISDEAMLETILNYGDWDDVLGVFEILGRKKAAEIFFKQIKNKRVNYRPKTLHYFKLYFKKHEFSDIR